MRKLSSDPVGKLHKAGEDYLETILVLQQQKGMVRSVDVARALNFSKPSVSNAVSVLQQAGYLTVDGDHFLHLTQEGLQIAQRIYERHCFFKALLIDVGVDPAVAEEDACRMEHAISSESFSRLQEARKYLQLPPREESET